MQTIFYYCLVSYFCNTISPVKGEICSQVDGFTSRSTSHCSGNASLDFSSAPLETRNGVYIRAQLTTG